MRIILLASFFRHGKIGTREILEADHFRKLTAEN